MGASAYDSEGRRKYLNEAENGRFLAALDGFPEAHQVLCLTIYYTGCRVSEALNLTTESIDVEAESLVIRTLKKRKKIECRRVLIPAELLARLQALSGSKPEQQLWSYCRSTAWHIVKRVMRKAGIEGVQATVKGLRHGFGVRCAMKQIPINKIRDWMGHADSSTTEIYLNICDDEERELMERTW